MEGGVGHRGPGQTDRRYHGLGCQHAGAAHLYHDIPDHGLLDLRRILKGRGPPGELGRAAQPLPGGQIVDLQNRAVDVEAVAVPVLADVGNPGLGLPGAGAEPVRDDLEPELPQIVQGFAVGLEGPALAELEVKDQNIQLAGSGDFRVQLPERPGGGVAGIGEKGLSPLLPGLVEGMEHGLWHEDLAPDDQPFRRVLQPKRNGADGLQILGDILAHQAVAPGGPPDEAAVPVLQRHGQAVHLGLHGIDRLRR